MSCPGLVSKLRTPKIVWYQTDVTVVVRIMVQNVDDYFLHIECDHLLFSTTINNEDYYVCLYLFGTVIAEKTMHTNLGREIRITLIKAYKWLGWLRLQIENIKNNMIVLDPDHFEQKDWSKENFFSKERESFADYKRRHNITQILPVVPSSDEEESEDECMDALFY